MESALALDISTRVYGGDNRRESCVVLFFRRRLSLREIIAEKVRAEVERAKAKQVEYLSTRYLTDEDLSWARGGARPRTERQAVSVEREIERALEAFAERRYFVMIDGRRLSDLEEMVTLTPETKIQFVRILPLVGGTCWAG